ncbi:MAG: hypothetical protein JXB46_00060 [Candidatus Eisenbacteria bacterium]|nr:hypothetical protein [Candidatus Eisenbacteria bacterium]
MAIRKDILVGDGRALRRRCVLVACAAFGFLLACCGCARRVPIEDLEGSGADVWTRIVTKDGEELTGRLLSLDGWSITVELLYPIEGDVHLRTRIGRTELVSGATQIPGEMVDVTTGEDGRVAVVHRTLRTLEVASASFHESSGEQSLKSIVSLFLGPAVGGLAGLLF